jgi:hypothetical protein
VDVLGNVLTEPAYEAYGMAPLTRILGMSKEEALEVFAEAVKGVRNKNFHGYNFL